MLQTCESDGSSFLQIVGHLSLTMIACSIGHSRDFIESLFNENKLVQTYLCVFPTPTDIMNLNSQGNEVPLGGRVPTTFTAR